MVEQHLVERFDGADVVPLMTADEARVCIAEIKALAKTMRERVLELYERRGWVALGYESWRECVTTEFGEQERELYRALQAAQVEQHIKPLLTNLSNHEVPESHLISLSKVTPIEQPAVWQRAEEIAAEQGEDRKARHVEQAVREWKADDQNVFADPQAEEYEALVEEYEALVEERTTRVNAGLFTSATPEWYTPDHIIQRVIQVFGQIDLDPCSNSNNRDAANVPAIHYFTQETNGLAQPWRVDDYTRVYMNPPYGDEIAAWVTKLLSEYADEKNGIGCAIALLPARTDTAWFQPLFDYPICFVRGRLRFSGAENSAPFPSAVVYLGDDLIGFQDAFSDIGRIK